MKVPKYILKHMGLRTTRQFKIQKRQEMLVIEKAVRKLQAGAYYFPGHPSRMVNLNDAVRVLRTDLSAEKWGR